MTPSNKDKAPLMEPRELYVFPNELGDIMLTCVIGRKRRESFNSVQGEPQDEDRWIDYESYKNIKMDFEGRKMSEEFAVKELNEKMFDILDLKCRLQTSNQLLLEKTDELSKLTSSAEREQELVRKLKDVSSRLRDVMSYIDNREMTSTGIRVRNTLAMVIRELTAQQLPKEGV